MKTLIVGGGLAGMYAAYRLQQGQQDFLLLEGRARLGGRILSRPTHQTGTSGAFDLGPTWFWPSWQPRMTGLVKQLGLGVFSQFNQGKTLVEAGDGSSAVYDYFPIDHEATRFQGGAFSLITRLKQNIPDQRMIVGTRVVDIQLKNEKAGVTAVDHHGSKCQYEVDRLLLALPPRLIADSLNFSPNLPDTYHQRLAATPTWMGNQGKFIAVFNKPFWREQGYSGRAFSQKGPLAEIHDASPKDNSQGALFGFLAQPSIARKDRAAEIENQALAQLERLFGKAAAQPRQIIYKDWAFDPLTATVADQKPLRNHPQYGMANRPEGPWQKLVRLIGSEVSPRNGGYLEGALESVDTLFDDSEFAA